MITLNNISYKYPRKKDFALSDISIDVNPGEIFTLLGPNGAGKTTLIRILSGLIIPLEGSASICGYDLIADEYNARRKLGLVLGDERTFYFRLSGAQNLEFFGGLYGFRRAELRSRITASLDAVGLVDDARLQYMRYSTGMKKRLSMARALLHEPEVYLLDEPNSGVDPFSARKIREIIFSLKRQGKTIFLTTHDMEEADRMSDRIGFLKEGKLIKSGAVSEYKNLIDRKSCEILFRQSPRLLNVITVNNLINRIRENSPCDSIEFRDGTMRIIYNGSFEMNRVLSIISQSGLEVTKINTIEASLEDIFIKLAG